jgi:hypothetical protein
MAPAKCHKPSLKASSTRHERRIFSGLSLPNIVQEFELFRFLACQIIEQIGIEISSVYNGKNLPLLFRAIRLMDLDYLTIAP